MFRFLDVVIHWLRRVVTQPQEELNRWQMAVRFGYDLGRFGARQLQHDRAHQMAAALAFRTLFGLLPVLVVATVLVKALGLESSYLAPLERLFEFWGLNDVRILVPSGVDSAKTASTTLAAWLRDRVAEAEQVNVAAIGWVGLAVTAFAAISLMVTIENCFNVIYRAPRGRPWSARIPVYWFVLTISPLLIMFSTSVDASFEQLVKGLHARGWVGAAVGVMWSILAIWILLVAVYALFPNTRVRIRPAMLGAFAAAILLELGKRTMGIYLQNALSISQLYGSLGLIPLFMFWVYLMWMAVLFGLQVSATLQHLRGRQLAEMEQKEEDKVLVDPAVVTEMMVRIGREFSSGRGCTIEHLTESTAVPGPAVEQIVEHLVGENLIHRLAEAEHRVTLSRPPDVITLPQLLDIGFRLANHEQDDAELLLELRRAQRAAVEGRCLADVM